jgi:autotransporter-associated beta strand protein
MKTKSIKSFRRAVAIAITALGCGELMAVEGTWTFATGNGNWSDSTRWQNGVIPGASAGDIANLTANLTASRIVTINSTDVRLGDLNMADPGSSFFSYTLNASAGRSLILDGAGTSDATVDFRSGGNFNQSNNIDAPVILEDNAIFRSNTQMVARLRGVVSGTGKSVTFNNDTDGVVSDSSSSNGRFEVSGANTYTGTTTIDDVRVIALNNTAFGAPGNTVAIQPGGQIYFNNAAVSDFDYAIELDGDGWLEGTSYLGALRVEAGANVTGDIALKGNASVGNNSSSTAGIISGTISGDFSLTKVGARSLILGGNNTYTGATVVSAGTLLINGSLGGTSSTTVAAGAILGGSGTIANPVEINGALAAGTLIGTLSTGALTFNDGSSMIHEIDTAVPGGDLIEVNGDLTINPLTTLTLTELAAGTMAEGAKLTLISYSGTWNGGVFSGFADDSTFSLGSNLWRIDYNDTSAGANGGIHSNFATITVVPEPGAAMLVALVLPFFLRRRRRLV